MSAATTVRVTTASTPPSAGHIGVPAGPGAAGGPAQEHRYAAIDRELAKVNVRLNDSPLEARYLSS